MPDDALDSLLLAFWRRVMRDLAEGRPRARAWLDTPAFAAWAALSVPSSVAPEQVRARLLLHWRPTAPAA